MVGCSARGAAAFGAGGGPRRGKRRAAAEGCSASGTVNFRITLFQCSCVSFPGVASPLTVKWKKPFAAALWICYCTQCFISDGCTNFSWFESICCCTHCLDRMTTRDVGSNPFVAARNVLDRMTRRDLYRYCTAWDGMLIVNPSTAKTCFFLAQQLDKKKKLIQPFPGSSIIVCIIAKQS
uniref:Uncharacterized protein n=1 Tax=Arundo donax TaxID=35708 RepID=A0A0A9ES16_ARUDO